MRDFTARIIRSIAEDVRDERDIYERNHPEDTRVIHYLSAAESELRQAWELIEAKNVRDEHVDIGGES